MEAAVYQSYARKLSFRRHEPNERISSFSTEPTPVMWRCDLPFTGRVGTGRLESRRVSLLDKAVGVDEQLLSLLPASYRTESDNLVPPSDDTIDTCVEKELNLQRLSKVMAWLWIAGRPTPPRPLHYQLLLQREIFVTERMDMQLG
jgi:hypothetical protein